MVEWGGLLPAILAHTVIDVVLLLFIRRKLRMMKEEKPEFLPDSTT
jgi:hypothetical protein